MIPRRDFGSKYIDSLRSWKMRTGKPGWLAPSCRYGLPKRFFAAAIVRPRGAPPIDSCEIDGVVGDAASPRPSTAAATPTAAAATATAAAAARTLRLRRRLGDAAPASAASAASISAR